MSQQEFNLTDNIAAKEIKIQEIEQQIFQLEDRLNLLSIAIAESQDLAHHEAVTEPEEDLELKSSDVESPTSIEIVEDSRYPRNPRSLYRSEDLIGGAQDFTNHRYARKIWEEEILPFWLDRDKPKGKRFLGHINISREQSDEIIALVGNNLKLLDRFTERELNRFNRLSQDWIKIFTFAVSEYAYYYSDDRFWEGLCERWGLSSNQTTDNTLRKIVRDGIERLGLVEAQGGYTYVSTMWIQSGVPYRNLEQFADLLQDLANVQGWDKLAQDSAQSLSDNILYLYNRKYPQGGTLSHLLKNPEPIVGRIIRSIAKIAGELARQNLEPSILRNEEQRNELIGNLTLDDEFFLRDWEAIVKILTHQSIERRQRNDLRKAEDVYLSLDIADPGNIQLILPEQSLWKDEWENLRGCECHIAEANWQAIIPKSGNLEIPELVIDITQIQDEYSIQLNNDRGESLYTWSCDGIDTAFPCLIFDAFCGEYLSIDLDNSTITGWEEIICFTPRDVNIVFDEAISSIDDCIPSSIRGWKGHRLRRNQSKAKILIQSHDINWQEEDNNTPCLVGLKSDTRKSIYLEKPTLWLPPRQDRLTIELSVRDEDSSQKKSKYYDWSVNKRWTLVKLDEWIDKPGSYSIEIDSINWWHKFQVIQPIVLDRIDEPANPQIYTDRAEITRESLPISVQTSYIFDAQIIEIRGLWSLEQICLILSQADCEDIYEYHQADYHGHLEIKLSEFSDFWDRSANHRSFMYQRIGEQPQSLLEGHFSTHN